MSLRRKSPAFLVVIATAALTAVVLTTMVPRSGAASNPKIAARVQTETAHGNATETLIVLSEQADLKPAASLPTKEAKGRFVVNALREVAARTQAPIIALLEKRGIPYQSFWVVNMIQVTGNRALLNELAARSDVKQIDANPQVRTDIPTAGALDARRPTARRNGMLPRLKRRKSGRSASRARDGLLPAPTLACNGTIRRSKVTIADGTAPKPITITTGTMPPLRIRPTPIDPHSHGTFTVSQMVGDDGHGNQIGVAPGAQWIACRNMDSSGIGSPTTYSECFQFLMAPYPVGGNPSQGDPTKAPDSINNSWGCPPSEGCSANTLLAVVNSVRAAGIFPAVAAGNSGSSCSSITDPPSLYDSSVTVGATDSANTLPVSAAADRSRSTAAIAASRTSQRPA